MTFQKWLIKTKRIYEENDEKLHNIWNDVNLNFEYIHNDAQSFLISNIDKISIYSFLFFYILSLRILCQTRTNCAGCKSDSGFYNDICFYCNILSRCNIYYFNIISILSNLTINQIGFMGISKKIFVWCVLLIN
jgi:hypothetical protein